MADRPYFISSELGREINPNGRDLPTISEGLNSVRSYSFEIHFELPPGVQEGEGDNFLTLAAKQVSQVAVSTEAIEVHRVNDRVYYPGKPGREPINVTFDNLYQKKVVNTLYNWYQSIYDPLSGELLKNTTTQLGVEPRGNFKAREMKIFHLDPQGNPLMTTKLMGVYPTSWATAEFNYGTNDFHTVQMTFSYDFVHHGTSRAARAR